MSSLAWNVIEGVALSVEVNHRGIFVQIVPQDGSIADENLANGNWYTIDHSFSFASQMLSLAVAAVQHQCLVRGSGPGDNRSEDFRLQSLRISVDKKEQNTKSMPNKAMNRSARKTAN